MTFDPFQSRDHFSLKDNKFVFYNLYKLEKLGFTKIELLPYSIRIMLESLLRQCNEREITQKDVLNLVGWKPQAAERPSLPFIPARVIMQDFTGIPALVDLAAMRSAIARLGDKPKKINPLVPVDLVIDHSVQVDFFADPDALQRNTELEFLRNKERYEFLHWGQNAFSNLRIVPPAAGIVHQVNLEYLAKVVISKSQNGELIAFPDTLVGTDSHTTMINALGVIGWGVGGIEAEAAILGQPIDMLTPEVIGFKLSGELNEGVSAADLVLTITQLFRKKEVIGKFVEFYGDGVATLSLPDRATVANMAPEYGATIGFFPVDDETLRYLRLTGRSAELVDLVDHYTKAQGLFRYDASIETNYTNIFELDLSTVETSVAGPKRPQDRIPISNLKKAFIESLTAPINNCGYALKPANLAAKSVMGINGGSVEMRHGAVVIAAITSCTNTSNPSGMIAAGLLAKNAHERGLKVKPYVKTSMAPGSRVVTSYLEKAGLTEPLASLGFNVVGYGCTTCIGNSGPLQGEVIKAISSGDLVVASVLSGNRNFEGRIHPYVRANFLTSPAFVVAYALAGTVDIDLNREPLGMDQQGNPVYLRAIWPTRQEIDQIITQFLSPDIFAQSYAAVFLGNETWNSFQREDTELYPWNPDSTYIQEPPFFFGVEREIAVQRDILRARVLVMVGDSLTTDQISPAGSIPAGSPAGKYLISKGISVREFNSYGARRGNDQVMTRGTFANIRLNNQLVPDMEGGITIHFPSGIRMSIYDAAINYQQEKIPLIVLAGKEYGTGSSRDWAAKGTMLLGIKAVIAESYERIHRSNLVGMGVLPLQFLPANNSENLGITGREIFNIKGLQNQLVPNCQLEIEVEKEDGEKSSFKVIARLDTPIEIEYYHNGGILNTVLRRLAWS